MATSIRLARGGSKKRPYYKIVVADSRSPRDGRFIERIGSYNPLLAKDNPERVKLDADRAKHWLRSEEHTSELQSLMRISYAVFCLKKQNDKRKIIYDNTTYTPNTN